MTHDMTTHGGGGQRGCNGSKLQQAQHAIATMMKIMLHEDGTEHEVNSNHHAKMAAASLLLRK